MKRKASAWSKAVRIELVKREWTLKTLATKLNLSHEYVIALINERVYSDQGRKAISDLLDIPLDITDEALST